MFLLAYMYVCLSITLMGYDEKMFIMNFVSFQFTLQHLSIQHFVQLQDKHW